MEAFAHWVVGVAGALSAEPDAAEDMYQAEPEAGPCRGRVLVAGESSLPLVRIR